MESKIKEISASHRFCADAPHGPLPCCHPSWCRVLPMLSRPLSAVADAVIQALRRHPNKKRRPQTASVVRSPSKGASQGRDELPHLCRVAILLDNMRVSPHGTGGWRLCPAKALSAALSFCISYSVCRKELGADSFLHSR